MLAARIGIAPLLSSNHFMPHGNFVRSRIMNGSGVDTPDRVCRSPVRTDLLGRRCRPIAKFMHYSKLVARVPSFVIGTPCAKPSDRGRRQTVGLDGMS